jgi:UPF0755 protein
MIMNKTGREVILFGLLCLAIAGLTHGYVLLHAPTAQKAPEKLVEISRGMGIKQISTLLKRQEIIKYPLLFSTWARLTGVDQRIKAGEYSLSASLPPVDILALLEKGEIVLHKATIPEGSNIRQIAQILAAKGLVDEAEFIAAAHDQELIKRRNIPTDSLEGYLFPDTYHFQKGVSAKAVVRTMLEQFDRNVPAQWRRRIEEMGFTLHQMVTLASLIEKEVGVDDERALISAVYHNRLKANIRLQCDPTVIYAVPDFDGNLTRKHLKLDSPYNTYRYRGLPPGPIANPGRASIEAAMNPADVDYVYFVSRNDGTHQFSTTLKEHNRAVFKYQKRRRRRRTD